ncbi:GntR family transcriptional regulator [Paenibacillus spongiae]|uniref:GntR family transcriptional regulator n=1 Tax=Paenibacillus spongiae TaxID=2909671 RepID=A0ABY5S6K4_9BACL|nr:GntR family transcriptional regulator [Paenibacillus spongiae]UVI29541.1 GntR family transcriptional regulator [Paenibacillus spongiae]
MSEFTFKQQANTSLREKVTSDLREAILSGNLLPGARLREMDIAQQMGISRGPVREAIRQLEREGLLISYPYKETVVADLDSNEVRHILIPIRLHIESYVIKRYLNHMDDAFFARLQNIVDDMRKAYENDEKSRLVELDIQFHQQILELATERTVSITWQSIVNQIRLHFTKNLPYFKLDHIETDHQLLLDALRTKDAAAAEQAIIEHLASEDSLLCFDE